MLDGKYLTDEIRTHYRETQVTRGVLQVSLGVARDLSGTPASTVYCAEAPLIEAGDRPQVVTVKHFCMDEGMAPAGKSTVVVEYTADYDYWKALHADPERYRAEKERVAAGAIALLEKNHPGLATQVEVVDVATPVTAERYTGSWQGSPMGFNPRVNRKSSAAMQAGGLTRTLPGLENFYMVGQWAPSGGVGHRDGQLFMTQPAA